jgi:membrane-associated phospholipid phosphatase
MLLTIFNTLSNADRWLFEKINGQWTNDFFDTLFPFAREGNHWLPLYLFLLVFITLNFKNSWWWTLFAVCTVALTDMTGTYLFKKNFARLRPCNDPEFFDHVRLVLDRCGGGFSFISNHAANHFGMTAFIYLTLRTHFRSAWLRLIFLWPALIAYSQVYVGVHYPTDVICGSLWGILVGSLTAMFFNKRYGIAIFDNQLKA